MSKTDSFPRSEWTASDILIVAIAFALLIVATGALALRDQWAPLVGAFSDVLVAISAFNTTDYHALAFDQRDPNIVYFGHHNGVMKSIDGGITWSPVLGQGDAMSLATIDNAIILAGHEVFMRSDDGGANWKPIATDLPDQDIHGFAVSPNNPSTFFAYIVTYGLWRSDDAGATWSLVSKELPNSVLALAIVPTSPETVYAGTMDKGLLKSIDGGKTWQAATGFDRQAAMTLTQDPRAPQIVFAGTESGLYRSNVEGTTWTRVAMNGKDVMTLAISRANPSRFLVVDGQGRVYRSDNGGSTWKK